LGSVNFKALKFRTASFIGLAGRRCERRAVSDDSLPPIIAHNLCVKESLTETTQKCIYRYVHLLTYLLHGAETFLRS
jgi:hypothetical protein